MKCVEYSRDCWYFDKQRRGKICDKIIETVLQELDGELYTVSNIQSVLKDAIEKVGGIPVNFVIHDEDSKGE